LFSDCPRDETAGLFLYTIDRICLLLRFGTRARRKDSGNLLENDAVREKGGAECGVD